MGTPRPAARRTLTSFATSKPAPSTCDVYGVVLHVDGTATTLYEPVDVGDVQRLVDSALDIARVRHPALDPSDPVSRGPWDIREFCGTSGAPRDVWHR
jgi:hypothetical protein